MLHAARWKCRIQELAQNRHLGTIAQLCRAISSKLRMYRQSEKKLVKQQYLLYMSPQYGELLPTSGWDTVYQFGASVQISTAFAFCSVTAQQSSCERQPNFAALNRGRHLCSAGWQSHWELAHISSFVVLHSTWKCYEDLFFIILIMLTTCTLSEPK